MLALSVDVEQPFSKVVSGTQRILDVFDEHAVKGTFFIVGNVAEQFPELVLDISNRGHEVGFHGAQHTALKLKTKNEFLSELKYWKHRLEDMTGQAVQGYRAPYFSLERRTQWAFDALSNAGFGYDSSLYPGVHTKYGWFGGPKEPVKVANTALVTFPVPLISWYLPLAFSGGGFLALLPKRMIELGMKLNMTSGKPGMIYIHPWQMRHAVTAETRQPFRIRSNLRDHILNTLGRDKIDTRLQLAIKLWTGRIGTMHDTIASLNNIPTWSPS